MEKVKKMNYSTLTATELVKLRFQEHRELANKKGFGFNAFREYALRVEPCYNSPHGWDRIRAVWYGKNADLRLTELLIEWNSSLTDK